MDKERVGVRKGEREMDERGREKEVRGNEGNLGHSFHWTGHQLSLYVLHLLTQVFPSEAGYPASLYI